MDGVKALGIPDIRSDSVLFWAGNRTWRFPTFDVVGKIAHYNGCAYEAKVADLDALEKKNGLRR